MRLGKTTPHTVASNTTTTVAPSHLVTCSVVPSCDFSVNSGVSIMADCRCNARSVHFDQDTRCSNAAETLDGKRPLNPRDRSDSGGLLRSALDIIASEPHNHGLRMECNRADHDRLFVHVGQLLRRIGTRLSKRWQSCNRYQPASVSDCLHNIYNLTSKLNATISTRDQSPLTSAAM